MKSGIIFGKFFPLHTGHIHFINQASSLVEKLHIFVCWNRERDSTLFKNSRLRSNPTAEDRLRWVAKTFQFQDTIKVHLLDESAPYSQGWQEWSQVVQKALIQKRIQPEVVFTSELADVENYQKYLNIRSIALDADRKAVTISATQIRTHPFRYWDYIPHEVKPFFVRTIAIVGGESSGKSILVKKLAHVFNTTSAGEYGRSYVEQALGGTEEALQYSDYPNIALEHHKNIEAAVRHANKIAFIDTDYLTTQAFCVRYEGRPHPVLDSLIQQFPFDTVIVLENNTPWIADGLRSLGSPEERVAFQQLLKHLLEQHKIPYTTISSPSYLERYNEAVALVKKVLSEE